MSILADLSLILTVLKEIDTFLGTLPSSPEVTAVKSKLDSALAVVTPFASLL